MGVERPWVLLLLPIALGVALLRNRRSSLLFPSLDPVPGDWAGRSASFLSRTGPVMLLVTLLLLAAGIRIPHMEWAGYDYGASIVFILDESASMAEPFELSIERMLNRSEDEPSKFQAAKSYISRFVEKRKTGQDLYGLIAFGSSAIKVLPLTFNRSIFLACLDAQNCILGTTVISQAVALGLDELVQSDVRSRLVIFVSDGGGLMEDEKYNFSGIFRDQGIRFYWIALGDDPLGEVKRFIEKIGPLGRRIDASSVQQLDSAFDEVHKLERSLIAHRSSSPAFSLLFLVYTAFVLLVLVWVTDSLFVYSQRN